MCGTVGGTVNLRNNIENQQAIYLNFFHELGIHGIGMRGHSDDPAYLSYGTASGQDLQEAELKVVVNHVLNYNLTKMYNFVEE